MHSLNGSFVSGVAQQARISESEPTLNILKRIIVMSIPLSFAQLSQFSINLVMIAVAGSLGVNELGGASLAYGLINATAFAFASGFCGALETVLSHSYGRDPKSKLYGVYAQRMFLMLMLVGLFLTPIILFIDRILLFVGQSPDVVTFTGEFCRTAIWGVFPAMMLELLRRYFACQHLNYPLSVNLVFGAAVFPFILIGCVKAFGFVGAPIGWCILMLLMSGSLWCYLVVTKKYEDTWGGWDDAAFTHWGPLLRLAIPSMGMMLSEWVSLEVNNIFSGFGTPEELAAFGITFQLSGVCWAAASGTFIAASVLVGNAIGEGKPTLARRVAFCCIGTSVAISLLNLTIVMVVKDIFPYWFTDSEVVVAIFHSLLKYFMVYHTFDALQSCMMGVLRGCGMQKQGAFVILLVYTIVGVPLGFILFIKTQFGIEALWFGPAFGVTVIGFPCYMFMLLRYIPWGSLKAHTDHHELDVEVEIEEVVVSDTFCGSMCKNSSVHIDSDANGISEGLKPGAATPMPSNDALPTSVVPPASLRDRR